MNAPRCSDESYVNFRDSSLISTSVRMVHPQRTPDEKRPGRGRQRINPREFATTGPRTPETAANYLLHRGLRQDGGGDQRGVSNFLIASQGRVSCSEAERVQPRFPFAPAHDSFTRLLQRLEPDPTALHRIGCLQTITRWGSW